MKVGLLVIGSEVLEGKITDTNTRALAEFLAGENLYLEKSTTVRDSEKSIHEGLSSLFDACDVVITSGGLGPTKDDITKSSLASFMGRKINYSPEAHAVAEKNYTRMRRQYPGKEHGYSWVPDGFLSLDNSTGFAPALYAEHSNKYVLCGAGVPREFKSLLNDHFVSLLGKLFSQSIFRENINIKTKKVPEEKIFSEVDPNLWDKLAELGDVCSLPNLLGVDIGVKIESNSQAGLDEKRQKVLNIFHQSPVQKIIWQVGKKSLEEVIIELAMKHNLTFGFAESCTGGLCSHRMTSVSGSSKVFSGSIVSYTNQVKENVLGVKKETIEKFSEVSEEVAKEMALGLVKQLKVKIGISITGIAGPTGGSENKPVGTFCLGIATQDQVYAHTLNYSGDRELLKNRFSQAALFALLEELEKIASL